ncbi:uncharacterized protein LOC131430160 [Malaya genurostris]|uniref:uncharacterized protein LOC131430160 n=1 Tax=Malaya genurostris TaxID=325434 RepID=UPI0026F3FCF5|nr:uncharacterized protein LOC131430160 [Malaya genurostris]
MTAKNEIDTRRNFSLVRQILNVNLNIDLLSNHLQEIFEAIQLAKLKVISKHILSTNELDFVIKRFEEQGIAITSTDEIYNFLELKAFHNQSLLTFIVSIPQTENSIYNHLLLEPLPVGQKILKPPASTALQSISATYFVISDCQRVQNNYLCTPDNLVNFTGDPCFSKLLQGSSGNCTFLECTNPTGIIKLTNNHLLLKQVKSLEVKSSCDLSNRNLSGTFLIEFHNCSISLNDTQYNNIELVRTEPMTILPLDGLVIYEKHSESTLNLTDIHLTNRKIIEEINYTSNLKTGVSITMSTTSIVVAVAIALILILRKRSRSVQQTINIQSDTVTKPNIPAKGNKPEQILNRDDSIPKEGRVMFKGLVGLHTPPPPTTTTTTTTASLTPVAPVVIPRPRQ